MKRLKIKKLIICLISIIILALVLNTISTKTFATGLDINNLLNDNDIGNEIDDDLNMLDDEDDSDEDENSIGNNANNNNSNNEVYNGANTNTNNDNGIPDTGTNDTIIFIIIACGISAVFAYKKIKDYRNI